MNTNFFNTDMSNNSKKIYWITRTAIMLALLITLQAFTAPLGITLLTGSLVNMMLVSTVMLVGLSSGLTVALISPVMAKFLGIGPLWTLIPFIAAGNCVLVLSWDVIANRLIKDKRVGYLIALAVSAAAKFLVLYLGIVRIMIPFFLSLPEKQANAISVTFSVSQLFTALMGGALALLVIPAVKKATNIRRK